jgi:Flp pilus assembly protein CpaB
LAWGAALVVALATARVVAGDLATLHRNAHDLGRRRTVVLAVHDLPLGAVIAAGDVERVTRYTRVVPDDALREVDDATGRIVVVPMLRDGVVTTRALAAANRTGLDAVVPDGRRAVHVALDDGFRPPPGAVVDVLAAFDPSAVVVDGSESTAVTVAHAARVVALDDVRSGDAGASGVTLLVTEDEARAVAFAATNAELSLALAPPETACCTSSIP